MIALLFRSGKGLSDSANSGAGSVDPASTGSSFGSRYASGVGGKSGEANAKGKSLADNAKSGAGSADGYGVGSNFGSGFVSGIGSWIFQAASKAAELASSAYNAAKKWLDEHSPSRKLGRWFSQGLAIGIEDDTKLAVKASEDMSNDILDAVNVDNLSEALKNIDVPNVMSRIYMAVDDRQSQVADKVTAAVSAKENIAWGSRVSEQKMNLPDEDIEKLASKFASAASYEMAKSLDGMKIYWKERELSRVIREVSK